MSKPQLLKYLVSFTLIAFFMGCTTLLINPNSYKSFIVDKFNEETNYRLHLNGDVEFSWWPTVTGLLNKISVSGSSDNHEAWFLAEKLSVSTDARQLLANHGVPHTIQISATDGIFHGFDVVAILNVLEHIIECKCLLPIPTSGDTRFDALTAEIFVENGIYSNQNLLVQGTGFTLTGKGTLADIKKSSIDYDLALHVAATPKQHNSQTHKLGNYQIPIHCRGDLSGPACTPDLHNIVDQIIKKDSKKKIKKLEKTIKKEAEKFLKGLLQF
jgi:hypothetical protein